jgi:hypothetical protein
MHAVSPRAQDSRTTNQFRAITLMAVSGAAVSSGNALGARHLRAHQRTGDSPAELLCCCGANMPRRGGANMPVTIVILYFVL